MAGAVLRHVCPPDDGGSTLSRVRSDAGGLSQGGMRRSKKVLRAPVQLKIHSTVYLFGRLRLKYQSSAKPSRVLCGIYPLSSYSFAWLYFPTILAACGRGLVSSVRFDLWGCRRKERRRREVGGRCRSWNRLGGVGGLRAAAPTCVCPCPLTGGGGGVGRRNVRVPPGRAAGSPVRCRHPPLTAHQNPGVPTGPTPGVARTWGLGEILAHVGSRGGSCAPDRCTRQSVRNNVGGYVRREHEKAKTENWLRPIRSNQSHG